MATGRHGITVECDALERLADFTPDDEESTWAIPAPYDGEISQFIKKAIAR
jgi:hypothetical protein